MSERARKHRVLKAMAWLCAALSFAVSAPFLLALHPAGRRFLVKQALAVARREMDYELELARLDRLDPWGLELRGVALFDPRGRELVRVERISVRLRPRDLVRGTVHVTELDVRGVRARLPAGKGEKEEPEQPPSGRKSGTPIRVLVDALSLHDATLDAAWSGHRLHAVVSSLSAAGSYGDQTAVVLRELTMSGDLDGERAVALRTKSGRFDVERGGALSLEGELGGAPVSLDASVGPLPEGDAWPTGTAKLALRGVTRDALERLGIADGAKLEVPVSLELSGASSGRRAELTMRLRAGNSRLLVRGQATQHTADVSLELTPTTLQRVSGVLPELEIGGSLRARYDATTTPERVRVSWEGVRYERRAVPNGSLRASLTLPTVRLDGITLAGLEHALSARASYDTRDATGSVDVAARGLELASFDWLTSQPLAGRLDGRLRAAVAKQQAISGQGTLRLHDFRLGSTGLEQAGLDFTLAGTLPQPRGRIELNVARISAGDTRIDSVSVGGRVTPSNADLRVVARGPDTGFVAEVSGRRSGNAALEAQGQGSGQIRGRAVRFGLRGRYDAVARSSAELSLTAGAQTLGLRGALDGRTRQLSAELDARHIDIGSWASLMGVKDVSGTFDAAARAEGSAKAPRANASVRVSDLAIADQAPVQASLELTADTVGGRLAANLDVHAEDGLATTLALTAALPRNAEALSRALLDGRFEAAMRAHLPVKRLGDVGGTKLAALEGTIDADLHARGTLDEPDAQGTLAARLMLPTQTKAPPETLEAYFTVGAREGGLGVVARDTKGELLRLQGELAWPGGNLRSLLEEPQRSGLPTFHVRGKLSERQLDAMQGVYAYLAGLYDLKLPIRTRADVDVRSDGTNVDGTVHTRTIILSDKFDARCALGTQSQISVDLALVRNQATVTVDARAGARGRAEAKLTSLLSFEDGAPSFGPARLDARGERIALPRLPGLCDLAAGTAAFTLAVEGIGAGPPTASLELGVEDVRTADKGGLGMLLHATADAHRALAQAELAVDGRSAGQLRAEVPLAYEHGATPTLPKDAPLSATLELRHVPLAPFLALGDQLSRPTGNADVSLSLSGTLSHPWPRGTIELHDVGFSVAALAQPVRGLNGFLELRGNELLVQHLVMRDRGGKAVLDGKAKLAPDGSAKGELKIAADDFPLRRQGLVVGELTTRTTLEASVDTKQRVSAEVRVGGGRMWLTGAQGRDVQSLARHPDVHYLDEPEEKKTKAEEQREGGGLTLAMLRLRSQRDIWLMHEDFSVQLGFDLGVTMEGEVPKLEGVMEIRRGQLNLLGKPFDIEKGTIRLTGAIPPDPALDLRAVYQPPSGQKLIVEVHGQASQPQLVFSGAADNIGDAVALLTGVGRTGAETQAQDEARNFALGVTAGLLSVAARHKLGDWVPMLSVETNESTGVPTARAGFDASNLIPSFLRGIARSAYVEGIVGSTPNQQVPGGSVGLGVRLELALPHDFVTSAGYGPGTTWGVDFAWAP